MENIIPFNDFIGATAVALYTIALGFIVGGIIKLYRANNTIFTSAWMYLLGMIGVFSLLGSGPITGTQTAVAVLSTFLLINASLITLFKIEEYKRIRDTYSSRDTPNIS